MKMCLLVLLLSVFTGVTASAGETMIREWMVENVRREALITVPSTPDSDTPGPDSAGSVETGPDADRADAAGSAQSPLVFVFHGHGGGMRQVSRSFRISEYWPEAIVVCMQGLNTPGQLTDPEGKKTGWQKKAGDQGDRDLKFFDAVLTSVKSDYRVDSSRIFATGHSNGGAFTYLLWAERYDVFAAMAPSGAAAIRLQQHLLPMPVMHIAGENDPLVRFAWQNATIEAVRKINRTGPGQPWEKNCIRYPSEIDAPVVVMTTSGGHKFPADAPPLIVRFFQQTVRKTRTLD